MTTWRGLRERHRDELRGHVRRAAVDLVVEHGIAAVSMSQLAQRAGVPRATLYTHYPTVEHALADWLDAEVATFRADLDTAMAGHDDPLDRLGAYLIAQCRVFAGDGPGLGGASAVAAGPPGAVLGAALARHVEGFRALVRDLLDEAAGRGRLRTGLDTALHAALVVALVDGARPAVAAGRLAPEAAAAEILALLREGIGVTAGAR
jgi:AcrR family transcriptional regulator